jgi:hypothetical protein
MRLPGVLLLLLLAINVRGQNPNLVSNGSFEQYINCPTSISQVTNYCAGWRTFTKGNPDYYHGCHTTRSVGIPRNSAGFQVPAQGNAYVGLLSFEKLWPTMYKEYIAASIPPLTIGATYEVSMSVSLANHSAFGTDDLGVWFYDNGPVTMDTYTLVTSSPQVSYSSYGPIIDTQNWVRLNKIFVADSTYDNIVIGGFKDWSTIDTQRVNPGGHCYYLIDSVVINQIDTLSFSYHDTLLLIGDSIIAPFAANAAIFSPSNVFTLQLSNATGSFASPTTVATLATNASGILRGVVPGSVRSGSGYKIRIVSSHPVKTIIEPRSISIGVKS